LVSRSAVKIISSVHIRLLGVRILLKKRGKVSRSKLKREKKEWQRGVIAELRKGQGGDCCVGTGRESSNVCCCKYQQSETVDYLASVCVGVKQTGAAGRWLKLGGILDALGIKIIKLRPLSLFNLHLSEKQRKQTRACGILHQARQTIEKVI